MSPDELIVPDAVIFGVNISLDADIDPLSNVILDPGTDIRPSTINSLRRGLTRKKLVVCTSSSS